MIIFSFFSVDADEDITSFDPYSPVEKTPSDLPCMNTVDALEEFDNIPHADPSRQNNGLEADDSELFRSRQVIVKSRGSSMISSVSTDKSTVRSFSLLFD